MYIDNDVRAWRQQLEVLYYIISYHIIFTHSELTAQVKNVFIGLFCAPDGMRGLRKNGEEKLRGIPGPPTAVETRMRECVQATDL